MKEHKMKPLEPCNYCGDDTAHAIDCPNKLLYYPLTITKYFKIDPDKCLKIKVEGNGKMAPTDWKEITFKVKNILVKWQDLASLTNELIDVLNKYVI